jgi:hypothetical protein
MKTWMIVAIVAVAGLLVWFMFLRKKPEAVMQAPRIVTDFQTVPIAPVASVLQFDSEGYPYTNGPSTVARSGRGHF